jgi:hypothetical protein
MWIGRPAPQIINVRAVRDSPVAPNVFDARFREWQV